MAKRRGVGPLIMLMIMLAVVVAIIIFSQGLIVTVGLELSTILTEMPTFYEYAEDGGRLWEPISCNRLGHQDYTFSWDSCIADKAWSDCETTRDPDKCHVKPSVFIDYYWMLAGIGLSVMVIALCISMVQYLAEGTGMVAKGQAVENVKKIVPYIIFILILPTAWDPIAITIEEVSLFLMAPFPPEHDPYINVGIVAAFVGSPEDSFKNHAQLRGAWLFMEAGSIVPPSVWQPETLVGFIFEPDKAVANVLTGAFLGVFKAYVVIMLGLEMWVSGIIRVMATMITVMAMPIMLPLSLLPKFSDATKKITSALSGLMIAPIFSALVFTIGLAYLSSARNEDELVRWLQAVCVCFLCSAAVTTLAGGFFMQAEQKVTAALKTALVAAAMTVASAVGGGGGAVGGMGAAAGGAGVAANAITGGLGGAVNAGANAASSGSGGGGGGSEQVMGPGETSGLSSGKSTGAGKPGKGVQAAMAFTTATKAVRGTVGAMSGGHGQGEDAPFEDVDTPDVGPRETGTGAPPGAGAGAGVMTPYGTLPDEVKTKGGETIKRPDEIRTKKPSFTDYFKAFALGAVAGGIGPMMQGAVPSGSAGMEKLAEPITKQATNYSGKAVAAQKTPYEETTKYLKEVAKQNKAAKEAGDSEKSGEKNIKKDATKNAKDSGKYDAAEDKDGWGGAMYG